MDGETRPAFSFRYLLLVLLFLSLALRWALIFQGGQGYFPDEERYQISREVANSLRHGEFKIAIAHLFTVPEHLGFKIIGILPAFVDWTHGTSLIFPAMFFSSFSVLNLYLIYIISSRLGAPKLEAVFALALAALNNSLFYYSRHLLPYDVSMFFGLLSLYFGLSKDSKETTSLICGASGMFSFIAYNGYWPLASVGIIIRLLHQRSAFGEVMWKGVTLSLGFLLPLVALLVLGTWVNINLLAEYQNFAQTVTQGSYSEGWSLPFRYFWSTEQLSLIVLGLLSLYACFKSRFQQDERTIIITFCGIYLYLCLLFPSVITNNFVVYGRLARQLSPFLILLSAMGLSQLSQRGRLGSKASQVILTLIITQTFWNFGQVYSIAYPRDFTRQAQERFKDFYETPARFGFRAPQTCESNGYVLQNAKYFLKVPASSLAIPGNVLMAAPHPVNFPPYQYEGYGPEERQAFQKAKLTMTLLQIKPATGTNILKEFSIESCLNK